MALDVRLPEEFEWQQAATSGDAERTWPWGSHWDPATDPHRANTFESILQAMTAVGMYPAGASPLEVLDLAGTVWERCLNKHDEPQVTQSRQDDFASRVLRGGSWFDSQVGARAANRFWNSPINRNNNVGFRVVCSSPSSGH